MKPLNTIPKEMIKILLCPWTWLGATSGFLVTLQKVQYEYRFETFALFVFTFGIALWLQMNIMNVRGDNRK